MSGMRTQWACTALMAAGLVAMVSPLGDAVPGLGWQVAFGLVLCWSVTAMLRDRSPAGRLGWARQALASAAMVSMALVMPMSSMGAPSGPGWLGGQLPTTTLRMAGLALCACLGVWSALSLVRAELPATDLAAAERRLPHRLAPVCDLAMAAGMAYLLVAR